MRFLSHLYSELLVFALVAVGVAGAVVEMVFFSQFILSDRFWYGFLGNILFLNTLHALISYRLLRYQVFKEAFVRGMGGSAKFILIFGLGIFSLLCIHFYIDFNEIPLSPFWLVVDTLFAFYFIGFLRAQHTAYQAYGILQNYNEEPRLDLPLKDFLKKEKFVFLVFFTAMIISTVFFFSRSVLKSPVALHLQLGFAFLALCSAAFIIFRSIDSHGVSSKRTFFSFRFLLLPLKYTSLTAAFCNFSCHGVEYYWITRRIEKNCKEKKLKASPLGFALTAFLSLSVFSFLVGDYLDARPQYREFFYAIPVVVITSLSQITSILHFHMDRYFFRFKDEETLREIGPLLKRDELPKDRQDPIEASAG